MRNPRPDLLLLLLLYNPQVLWKCKPGKRERGESYLPVSILVLISSPKTYPPVT